MTPAERALEAARHADTLREIARLLGLPGHPVALFPVAGEPNVWALEYKPDRALHTLVVTFAPEDDGEGSYIVPELAYKPADSHEAGTFILTRLRLAYQEATMAGEDMEKTEPLEPLDRAALASAFSRLGAAGPLTVTVGDLATLGVPRRAEAYLGAQGVTFRTGHTLQGVPVVMLTDRGQALLSSHGAEGLADMVRLSYPAALEAPAQPLAASLGDALRRGAAALVPPAVDDSHPDGLAPGAAAEEE